MISEAQKVDRRILCNKKGLLADNEYGIWFMLQIN